MIRLIRWLVYRLGPRTLLMLSLLLIALGSVALGLVDSVRGLDARLLLPVAALGLLVGWGLAKSPLPGWLGGTVALGLGVEFIILRVGRLGGALLALLRALVAWAWEVWRWRLDGPPDARPVLLSVTELLANTGTLSVRLYHWALGVASGQSSFDLVAVAVVWSLALWAAVVWAGWVVRRCNQPLLALTPAGVLLTTTIFYVWGNPAFLLPLLGMALFLSVLVGQNVRERRWEATGLDFPFDVGHEVAFGGAVLSLVLVLMAMLAPSISLQQVTNWVGRMVGGASSEARPAVSALGLELQASSPATFFDQSQVRAPGLPRRHLLGSGPELSEQVVMVIYAVGDESADEPSLAVLEKSAPRHYWRSLTYDRYTGRGWYTGQTEVIDYGAGALAVFRDAYEPPGVDIRSVSVTPLGRRRIHMEVRAVAHLGDLVHAAGDLVAVDQDYRVAWRSSNDAFGAVMVSDGGASDREDVSGEASEAISIVYRTDSLVPVVGEVQLRSAGGDYPTWVRNRYLNLPEEVPARVLALARDLTATEPTPYDQARAIETYLRTFPYTLDMPPPPGDQDVVDYFLFDLQQGYCDYYATAMVVLARAAGLPARLAMGYYSGIYDGANARYVVTEADAHAWVEIYFPGYGWIEFEPTAGRPLIDRPEDAPPVVPPELEASEPAVTQQARGGQIWRLGLPGVIVLLGLAGATWSLVDRWRLRRLSPKAAITVLYSRLYRHGRRLAVPAQPGDTPFEFVASFADYVTGMAQGKLWAAVMKSAVQEAHWLADLYVRTCYAPHSPDAADLGRAMRMWSQLRRRLWLAWVYQVGSVVFPLTSAFSRPVRRVERLPTG